jgi:uncharacterized protein
MAHTYTAFESLRRIATGEPTAVAREVVRVTQGGSHGPICVFDDATGEAIDVERAAEPEVRRQPGRPKLGVVAREVTLLPRHWEWLASQPGGASVALRKLVEHARKSNEGADRIRQAREAAYRVMSALTGNEPNFEEALRALFAGDKARFAAMVADWPEDAREYCHKIAAPSFTP